MPKIVDREQYRQELLNKSFELFAQKGYAAVTMRQIAEEIGVSTGTLYHYFPSKESLFEELVEYISDRDTAEQNIADLGTPATLAEKMKAIGDFISKNEEYFLNQTLMLIDFARQKKRKEINNNKTLQQAGDRYERAVMNCLDVEDVNAAMLIIHLIDGLLIRRLYVGDRASISAQTTLLGEMLTAYLEKRQLKSEKL